MVGRPAIILDQVRTGYRSDKVLAEIPGLEFNDGGFYALLGLNGVGKSTLLRSIAGLQPLLEGSVIIDGKKLSKMQPGDIARHLAIVLTEKVTGFNLRVNEAVSAGQMPYTDFFHRLKKEHQAHIRRAMDLCGLTGHENSLLHELSDGLLQKAMIARGIAQNTNILLLDEPTAFIDFASGHKLFSSLKELTQKEDRCVLVTTHDLQLALRYCDKLLMMDEHGCRLLNPLEAKTDQGFSDLSGGFI